MNVVGSWLRLDIRRRWRSLLVLVVLFALTSGIVMATVAGARRGASATQRLLAHTKPATAAVYTNTPDFDFDIVRALPEVESLSTFLLDYAYAYPGYPQGDAGFPPVDDETLRSIETPVIFEGRMWNPSSLYEVVVTRGFSKHFHKHPGDTVVLTLPTPDELVAGEGSGPGGAYTGPRITQKIVGVVLSPWFSDQPGQPGFIEMSPAVVAKYPDNTIGPKDNPNNLYNFVSALVRLKGGDASLAAFQRDLAKATHRNDIEIQRISEEFQDAQRQFSFEARCLFAFGIAVLLAGLFLLGQAVSRSAAAAAAELGTLRPVGMTPRQTVLCASTSLTIAAAVGATLGVGIAWLASSIFPFGSAELLETAPGRSADWVVFGLGIALVIVLAALGATASAALALSSRRRAVPPRRSMVASAVSRWGLPVPAIIGTRFALESGRGQTAVPARSAIIGAVAGVLGVVAAFTFASGVQDAIGNPERFGQTAELATFVGSEGQDFVPPALVLKAIKTVPAVTGVNDSRQAVASVPGHDGTFIIYTYSGGVQPLPAVTTSGRMPAAANEVVLATLTAKKLGIGVGDTISLQGNKAGTKPRPFRVSGIGLIPAGPRNGYGDGGWMTPAGYDSIFSGFKFHILHLSLRSGADVEATNNVITAAIAKAIPDAAGFSFSPPDPPLELAEITQVRKLPVALGAFLGLLALGTVSHALVTAVRRRGRDVAVLRAVGMTQRQSRWVVLTQASVLALIGVVAGVPLGLALGRTVWRWVADYTPLAYVAPTGWWAVALALPVALVVANLAAALPGRRAARLRVAQILRAE